MYDSRFVKNSKHAVRFLLQCICMIMLLYMHLSVNRYYIKSYIKTKTVYFRHLTHKNLFTVVLAESVRRQCMHCGAYSGVGYACKGKGVRRTPFVNV